jgi:antitoxin (DNA-binding transcriptional repressor) of toxin-antitoxin stability system
MTSFIPLTELQARLPEILEQMHLGEKLFVTGQEGHVVATFIKEPPPRTVPRQPGTAAGKLTIVAEDDEHLKDFAEYMG